MGGEANGDGRRVHPSSEGGLAISFNFGGSSIGDEDSTTRATREAQLRRSQQDDADYAAYKKSPQYALDQENARLSSQNINDRLTGKAPVLSAAQQKMLDESYNATNVEGLRDINTTFANDAAARGLSPTDSPVANAKALSIGEFARGMSSTKANAALNLGQQGALFDQSLSNFQNNLRLNSALTRSQASAGYANPLLNYGIRNQEGNRSGWGAGGSASWNNTGGLALGGG